MKKAITERGHWVKSSTYNNRDRERERVNVLCFEEGNTSSQLHERERERNSMEGWWH